MGTKESGDSSQDMAKTAAVAVIGAGASGCMAAVSAAVFLTSSAGSAGGETGTGAGKDLSQEVLLIDGNDRVGRKIYATGNGRCNITNLHMDKGCYHAGGGADLSAFFARFPVEDHMRFWEKNGIFLHDRQGYVYPRTDQASTIAEGFEKILRKLRVKFIPGERVTKIRIAEGREGTVYRIRTERGTQYFAQKVILAGGGAAGPQYGCSGDMYGFAKKFGHTVTTPRPALVRLTTEDPAVRAAAGVRCSASVTITCEGTGIGTERGEIQINEKGISGIPVMQLSGGAVRALEEGRKVEAVLDFVPDLEKAEWEEEKRRRMEESRGCMLSEFFLGLVNRKVLDMVLRRRGLQAEKKAAKLSERELLAIMEDLRAFPLAITGAGTFREAQVTSGGVPLRELDENLQSLRTAGLYMAGELLDVDGLCGGYNLQWAATSGWIAGRSAAESSVRP